MAHHVVVVCSPTDSGPYRELQLGLTAAKRAGLLVLHSVADFPDDAAMATAIDDADIVLVLLTQALVNSSLWTGVALQQTKITADREGIPVVPIVVERCAWDQSWLGQRAPLPRQGIPIEETRGGASSAWAEVSAALQSVLKARKPRVKNAPAAPTKKAETNSEAKVENFLAVPAGSSRVILVHEGDAAGVASGHDESKSAAIFRPTLSVFATFVVEVAQNLRTRIEWEDANDMIASTPEFSAAHWRDRAVHLAKTKEVTFKFGGFSSGAASILASPSVDTWLSQLSDLVLQTRSD